MSRSCSLWVTMRLMYKYPSFLASEARALHHFLAFPGRIELQLCGLVAGFMTQLLLIIFTVLSLFLSLHKKAQFPEALLALEFLSACERTQSKVRAMWGQFTNLGKDRNPFLM